MSHTTKPVVEVAVYTVHDAREGHRAREDAYAHLQNAPGFQSWDRLVSGEHPTHFVDIVHWASHADAQGASDLVRADARFAPFVAAIDAIISFQHYERAG